MILHALAQKLQHANTHLVGASRQDSRTSAHINVQQPAVGMSISDLTVCASPQCKLKLWAAALSVHTQSKATTG